MAASPRQSRSSPQRPRQPLPLLDPKRRRRTADEVALGCPAEQAQREAPRCLQCPKPPASKPGPAHRHQAPHPPPPVRRLGGSACCHERAEPVAGRLRPGLPARAVLRERVRRGEEAGSGGDRAARAFCGRPRTAADEGAGSQLPRADRQAGGAGGQRAGIADRRLRPGAAQRPRDGARGAAQAGRRDGQRHSELPPAAGNPRAGGRAAAKHGRRVRARLPRGQDGGPRGPVRGRLRGDFHRHRGRAAVSAVHSRPEPDRR